MILVTGASGKVGQAFLRLASRAPSLAGFRLRALCHRRGIDLDGVETVRGSIVDREAVRAAMDGVTHVLHLATCKETPELVMDVTVKGLFWLLEEARQSPGFRQFVLVGGDASIGHFHYPRSRPLTEEVPHRAYPGCYALSKVLEEVMLEQYYHQYDLPGCCLRAPWIMEKDDFRCQLSFGQDVFGAPVWRDLVGPEQADTCEAEGCIPVLCDAEGRPVRRNFVHVEDLATAIVAALDHPAARQETFHVCMDEPVDYRAVADYLAKTRGLPSIDVRTPYHSTWMDNAKARFRLGWRPDYDLARMIDAAWDYRRGPDDPRVIHYPG